MATLLLRHHADSAAEARRALCTDLAHAQVGEEQIFDTLLVTAELIGNAVTHANAMPDGNLRVTWDLREGRARIEVEDGGSPTVPEVRAVGPYESAGRGLTIIESIADSWGYESADGCRVVWAELRLTPAR